MSKAPTPIKLHELNGSYIKNPQRRVTNAVRPKRGIGPCPETVSTDWKICWDEIINLICPGVLGDSDRIWMERAAKLLAESRNPESKWTSQKENDLRQYLNKMGLNPSDRARLTVPEEGKDDPADKYF